MYLTSRGWNRQGGLGTGCSIAQVVEYCALNHGLNNGCVLAQKNSVTGGHPARSVQVLVKLSHLNHTTGLVPLVGVLSHLILNPNSLQLPVAGVV